jgi:hypothetical protein
MNMKLPKPVKVTLIVLVAYAGLVAVFESMLGILQPERETTLVITTTDADGATHDRVLARLDSNDELFVAVNQWPRAWYRRALENPNVQVTLAGQRGDYVAVPASDEEHDRVQREHNTGILFRFMMGFAPRYFFRLEPRQELSGTPHGLTRPS